MLISVVMPVRNQRRFIAQAVDSVLAQSTPRAALELVVIDGQSDDGTLEWLQAYEDPRLRIFSAPDSGPAQAVNRGLARIRGTLVGWLNADDYYTPGAIARAVEYFEQHPDYLAVYGEGLHVDANGETLGVYPTRLPHTRRAAFADGCFICQPTVFFRRTFAVLNGPLDETLKAAFDFDWWLRAFKTLQARIGYLPEIQACSRLHPDSITLGQRERVIRESMQVVERHIGLPPPRWTTEPQTTI